MIRINNSVMVLLYIVVFFIEGASANFGIASQSLDRVEGNRVNALESVPSLSPRGAALSVQ